MFSALVTTVSCVPSGVLPRSGRTARARATSVVVVPPLSPTTMPGATSAAAAVPIRCFSAECLAVLYRNGRSYDTPLATAPPRVRVIICCWASWSKSRRMVACDTLSLSAASSTVTRPLSVSSSRSAFHRAYRSTGPPFP